MLKVINRIIGALKITCLGKAYVLTVLIFRGNDMEYDFFRC